MFGQSRKKNHRRPRLMRIEPLEVRQMMSVVSCGFEDGNLVIRGDDGPESITAVQYQASRWVDQLLVIDAGEGRVLFNMGIGRGSTFGIKYIGGNPLSTMGDANYFKNNTHLPSTLIGGSGDDTLYGGSSDDKIYGWDGFNELHGGGGDDLISGGSHNDKLYGDKGDDTLRGWDGNDTLYGGDNDDSLSGGDGHDTLWGGLHADSLNGGGGNDDLWGGHGNDTLAGGWGRDTLAGDRGNDSLIGGPQDDELHGDSGADTLCGGWGNDELFGGSGTDSLDGGDHDDILVSIDGATDDTLTGGSGLDSFWTDACMFSYRDRIEDASSGEEATNVHRIRNFRNGADKTLDGDDIADPTFSYTYSNYPSWWPSDTVSNRYRDFSDEALFAAAGPTADDIDQGLVGDCWLLATMGAIAHTDQNAIRQTVVSLGDGTYAVRLGVSTYYRVDADLPVNFSNNLVYAGLGVEDSLWAAIVEKAYVDYRNYYVALGDYASLAGGPCTEAFAGLNASGVDEEYCRRNDGEEFVETIQTRFDRGEAVTVGFPDGGIGSGLPITVDDHAYTVVDVARNGSGEVTIGLRNPHGPAGSAGAIAYLDADDLDTCRGWVTWATRFDGMDWRHWASGGDVGDANPGDAAHGDPAWNGPVITAQINSRVPDSLGGDTFHSHPMRVFQDRPGNDYYSQPTSVVQDSLGHDTFVQDSPGDDTRCSQPTMDGIPTLEALFADRDNDRLFNALEARLRTTEWRMHNSGLLEFV